MPADFDISPVPGTPSRQPPVPPQPGTPPQPAPPATPPPVMPSRSSRNLLKWAVIIAAVLLAVTVASLWWGGGGSFSASGVILEITAPERVTSGDEVTYTVKLTNSTKVALSDLSFRLFWPEDTLVLEDGNPTTPESEGWEVDRLEPGAVHEQELKGFLVGDKGALKIARVKLIFKAGTLQSAFEKEAAVTTAITDVPATLTPVAPPTAAANSVVEYLVDVRNDTDEDLTDLRLELKYPDGFAVQSMNPKPDKGNTTWDIAVLTPGQGKRFRISGVLPGKEGEVKTLEAVLKRDLNGQYVDYVRADASTMISSPLLAVALEVNGSRDYVSHAGDTLRYEVSFRNNSRYTLIGLLLGVRLEGDMYDTARLRVDDGFYDDASKTVMWDSSGIPALAQLPPGGSGVATFTVPLKAGFAGQSGTSSFFVKATARLATSNVPSGIDGNEVAALDSLITRISSQPTATQAALYDNGAGTGPLPPKVGEETTLTVRWQATNPGNDVRNTVVSGVLPTGVTFKGGGTASEGSVPQYDANTRRVTWTIGNLRFGTGAGTPPAQATFQISFRPSANQVSQSVPLVTQGSMTGTDSFTSQAIQVDMRDLTTDTITGHPDDGRVEP